MSSEFELFISYKNSDPNGEYTEDARIGAELYDELTRLGINAFYSNVSLMELGDAAYRRSIDAALDTAAILVVIGTSLDNINSSWVTYEWESFSTDILSGTKPHAQVISYTKDLSPSMLPRTLRSYQAYDMLENPVRQFAGILQTALETSLRKKRELEGAEIGDSLKSITSKKVVGTSQREKSNYNSGTKAEFRRLKIQADNAIPSDRTALEYMESQLPEDASDLTVLDVGCAYGYVTENCFGHNPLYKKVIAVDYDPKTIEKAREINENPKIHYEILDVESQTVEEDLEDLLERYNCTKVDVIYSSLVLLHLKNPDRALRKLRRFLKPGGFIVIRGSDDGSKMCYPQSKLMERIIEKYQESVFTSDRENGRKIYSQLKNAGFKNVRCFSVMTDTSMFSDIEDRERLFRESFAYRIVHYRREYDKNPQSRQAKEELDWMNYALEEFEEQFFHSDFWYCEYDYMGVAQR